MSESLFLNFSLLKTGFITPEAVFSTSTPAAVERYTGLRLCVNIDNTNSDESPRVFDLL